MAKKRTGMTRREFLLDTTIAASAVTLADGMPRLI